MKTQILKAAFFTPLRAGRWGLTLLCIGEPGGAKTSVIREFAASVGAASEILSPGERGEGAFGVVPVPDKGVLTYPRPDWTVRFDGDVAGLVFVDEMTTAPPALQAPLLGLLLEKRIGGHTLGPRVRMLGACNPPELAAGGFDLAASVANRVGHLSWAVPTVEEHAAYMMSGRGTNGDVEETLNAADEEARVLKEWPEAWARAVGLETAFLMRRSGSKNQCPKAHDPKASAAWPSDRTWEMATRALASSDVHNLSPVEREEFVASFISEGVASEFFAFMQEQDLPDPAALLDGKATFKHESKRLDRTVSVLNSCTSLVTDVKAPKRQARAAVLWSILQDMTGSKADLDIFVPSVHALIEAGLHAMKDAALTLAKVQPVLKAAGIKPQARR